MKRRLLSGGKDEGAGEERRDGDDSGREKVVWAQGKDEGGCYKEREMKEPGRRERKVQYNDKRESTV